ncbi:hypothetical protein [Flavobacterium seoulense]|uniref:Uncharacterized protein n=1 Tax=Flavobacterium seoulense TaxID=1492738 RepID=A0A066WJR5_9FLAO|nr:hypothetical protein [Flavobacterium seoulense]KDN54096.1 hypothetical protein FEM21_27490 [Flavobacterium seoulense]
MSEVISAECFHSLFKEFIEEESLITEQKQIELLDVLGEKFVKFYNIHELKENERKFISDRLIKLTHFSDINRISELIGLMFSFVDKTYYEFLLNSLETKQLSYEVQKEITESTKEFKKTYFNIL